MWLLFGTNYNTVENEPQVYFIGIFDNFALINQKRDELISFYKSNKHDIFIKEVTINSIYDLNWSNSDDI